ncbi:MAG: hypothetical protein CSB49_08585, partial [Proteobacteria bacterium]
VGVLLHLLARPPTLKVGAVAPGGEKGALAPCGNSEGKVMTEYSARIKDLAELLIVADPADASSVKEIVRCVETAEELAEPSARAELESCRRALENKIEKNADVGAELVEFELLVERLQERGDRPAEDDPDTLVLGELVLPGLVDEELLRDFLSSQVHGVEELEQRIMRLEVDGSEIATLKRLIHTIKGEASMLGLRALADVCHVVEDLLIADRLPPGLSDLLLEVKDWIESAVARYSRWELPEQPHDLLVRLRGVETAPEETAVEETAPEETAVEETAPEETAPEETAPEETAVEETAPEETAPEETAPEETAEPIDVVADRSLQLDAASRAAFEAELVGGEPIERDEEDLALIGEFMQESEEGLVSVDQLLLEGEREGLDDEKVNGIFRVFHTIKGVASFLEFEQITRVAHATETMLDQVRSGKLVASGTVFDLVFDATARMRALLTEVDRALQASETLLTLPGMDELVDQLKAATEGKSLVAEPLPMVEEGEKLGQILVRQGVVEQKVVDKALDHQVGSGRKLGQQLVAEGASAKRVAQALRAQGETRAGGAPRIRETVKVDLERIDALVENIGELVIVESMVSHAPEIMKITGQPRIRNYLGQLAKITRQLQEIGIRMRMVPLRGLFQKMSRMVRDLARKSEKNVRVEVSGTSTEMDRSMVEQLADPLVHLIRNSVDHGIELPEERRRAGKDPTGTIRLDARYEGSSVVVEISDDGRGLDREAIVSKALRQGLIKEGENLSGSQIDDLIFAPGFSTAKKVTEISGRGVGMDVVRRNVESLRGRIHVDSKPGQGTTLSLILPLTLAIIDGTLIACGDERYIFPTISIVESLRPTRDMLSKIAGKTEIICFRDRIYPLLCLGELMALPKYEDDLEEALVVLVESRDRRVALLVDDVLTQQQIVIKSLG